MSKKAGKTAKKKVAKKDQVAVAKQSDGTVQITFTVPWKEIHDKRESTIKELAKTVEVPGFRTGKAPIAKAREKLDPQFVLEKALSYILPTMFSSAIKDNNIRPAIYPKFELISAEEEKDWQVRATTAEIPEFELGDYKKAIKDEKKSDIWTPEKGDPKAKEELTREQRENIVITALQKHFSFTIPQILIDEEVNSRLASLLERIEKLGMSLESYMASVKKDVEALRKEYSESAEQAIRLDIVLGRLAEKENIKVTDADIADFMRMANTGDPLTVGEEQKNTISAFLIKRKVLDTLASEVE
jgi:FKBP-type peptidyl-prolyl cis-trans isomerase (trigger factor)